MVSDYTPSAKYQIGNLQPWIYLIPWDAAVEYVVDNGRCEVTSVVDQSGIYKVLGYNVTMSSIQKLEGRLKFNNTCSLIVSEGNYDRFTELFRLTEAQKYRVVVEDMVGNLFMVNVEFPALVTHTVNFSDALTPNTFSIDFSVDSNWPTLPVMEPIDQYTDFDARVCGYATGGIKDFRIALYSNAKLIEYNGKIDSILVANDDDFKHIKPIKGSLTFQEQYDGDKYKETIKFSIPLSEYKAYWQYNLVEFTDNRYVAIFNTDNDTMCAVGFDNGFIPSYTITTSQEAATLNTIEITMECVANKPTADVGVSGQDEEGRTGMDQKIRRMSAATVLLPVESFYSGTMYYETDVCIDKFHSMYILLEEQGPSGNRLGNFWVFEPYREMFESIGLNIVGTYSDMDVFRNVTLIHDSSKCNIEQPNCNIILGPENLYVFSPYNPTYTFRMQVNCDWEFENIPSWLTFDKTSGGAHEINYITMRMYTEPESGAESVIVVRTHNETYQFTVRFYKMGYGGGTDCGWLDTNDFLITAEGGTVEYYMTEVPPGMVFTEDMVLNSDGLEYELSGQSIFIKVPTNYSDENRDFKLTMKLDEKHNECFIIIQQHGFYVKRTVASGFICENGNKYQKIAVYYGWTEDKIFTFRGYEKGALIEAQSRDCTSYQTRWVEGEGFICVNDQKWTYETEEISYDDGYSWNSTGVSRPKDLIGVDSDICNGEYQYKWERWMYDYTCVGTTSHVLVYRYVSYDGGISWHRTGENAIGEPIRTDDPRCGGGDGIRYRWTALLGAYMCEGTTKYSVREEWYSKDNGVTWTRTGATAKGEIIEYDSSDCDGNYDYQWLTFGEDNFVCADDDKLSSYYVEYYCVSYDHGVSWHQTGETRRDGLLKEGDERCNDEGLFRFRNVDTDGVVCEYVEATDRYCAYIRMKRQYSSDGIEWNDVHPLEYVRGDLISCDLYECDPDETVIVDWVLVDGYICGEPEQTWIETGEYVCEKV